MEFVQRVTYTCPHTMTLIQSTMLPIWLSSLLLCISFLRNALPLPSLFHPGQQQDAEVSPPRRTLRNSTDGSAHQGMVATLEVMNGVEVVWQMPRSPRAVLFMAHGGFESPTDYFDKNPSCRICTGLPEHRVITLDALARGYAVIAVKSVAAVWAQSPLESHQDLDNVKNILQSWRHRHRLESLPLSAFGASSGGLFVTVLALELKIYSQANMISNVDANALKLLDAKIYPPIIFIRMPRDHNNKEWVSSDMEVLRSKGVIFADYKCFPKPLTPTFFSDRILDFPPDLSAKIYEALAQKKYLDRNGLLISIGAMESSPWDQLKFVADLEVLPLDMKMNLNRYVGWLRAVVEELRVAYAFHSLTREKNEEMFDWLDGKSWTS